LGQGLAENFISKTRRRRRRVYSKQSSEQGGGGGEREGEGEREVLLTITK
jgi:hypothetical protein